jgi:hypothetical protein
MAKKNQSKKHRFKHATPTEAVVSKSEFLSDTTATSGLSGKKLATSSSLTISDQMSEHDFSYVGKDLKHIAILAVALVAFEFGLAYLFNHTGIGDVVYTIIKF